MQCNLRGLLHRLLDTLALVWAAARRRRRDDLKKSGDQTIAQTIG